MTASTSFRLSVRARELLARRAADEDATATSVLERLIVEGITSLDHPGIVFRGPVNARRAGLAGGPDIWEIIVRLRELDGSEGERSAALSAETDLALPQIEIALGYAADHPDEIQQMIDRRDQAIARSERRAAARQALLE